nr:protein-methionine-sulfoxide reductase heme-binding subunit MsrQ [uncultured Roseovarius sp.]
MAAAINGPVRAVPAGLIYVGSLIYTLWLFWLGIDGQLGPNPVEALEHALGEAALYMLVAGLVVTPVRRFSGISLLKFRRAIGLSCFFFVLVHLLTWAVLDVQALDRVWADILKRPYITVGMAAFILMVPLALTSNNASVRRLGTSWRQLHKLTYPIAFLGGLHYLMLVKGWQVRPMIFLAIILLLLFVRFKQKARSPKT